MDENKFKMNNEQMEILLFGNNKQIKQYEEVEIKIGNNKIKNPVNSVKNIGPYFDSGMTMEKHIRALCKSLMF